MSSATTELSIPQRAIEAIRNGCDFLARGLFSCPKAPPRDNSFMRELLISFCAPGNVALFEIRNANSVIIGAVRHHREDDYT